MDFIRSVLPTATLLFLYALILAAVFRFLGNRLVNSSVCKVLWEKLCGLFHKAQ